MSSRVICAYAPRSKPEIIIAADFVISEGRGVLCADSGSTRGKLAGGDLGACVERRGASKIQLVVLVWQLAVGVRKDEEWFTRKDVGVGKVLGGCGIRVGMD